MPRGKDAPAITGGQIDPYVQQSIQQDKQLASNRLLTAMQERGATQRTAMTTSAGVQGQKIQSEAQLQIQAAQTAQDDKRAAEAERGRREDQEFTERLAESQQLFQAEQSKLQMSHEDAMNKGQLDLAEKIRQQQMDLKMIDWEIAVHAKNTEINGAMSIAKMMMKGDATKEKAKTTLMNAAKKEIQDKTTFAETRKNTVRSFALDKRMDLPIVGKFEQKMTRGMYEFGMHYEKGGLIPGTQTDPIGIMQDQMKKYNPNLEVVNLSPSGIHHTEQLLMDGKLTSEDIRSALSVIQGTQEVLDEKIVSSPAGDERDFWREKAQRLGEMEDSLIGLKNSKKQIKDSKMDTVGASVRNALGAVVPGLSLGGKVNELLESGMDWDAIMEEFTKGINPYPNLNVDPGMSPYAIDARTRINSIFSKPATEQTNRTTFDFGGAE